MVTIQAQEGKYYFSDTVFLASGETTTVDETQLSVVQLKDLLAAIKTERLIATAEDMKKVQDALNSKTTPSGGGGGSIDPSILDAKEDKANKVNEILEGSITSYPSVTAIMDYVSTQLVAYTNTTAMNVELAKKENTANKVINFTSPSNTTYPTTSAVKTLLDTTVSTLVPNSKLGAVSGVATLDANGKVVSTQLPAESVTSVNTRKGDITLAKADVGLSNVDNTSDANKPISTAQATALSGKVDVTDAVTSVAGRKGVVVLTKTDVGLSNVDNTSDANKPVSTAQATAIAAKADATNVVNTVAGRKGAVVLTKTDVGLANVDNTSDLNKPISTAVQTALDAKADATLALPATANEGDILKFIGGQWVATAPEVV